MFSDLKTANLKDAKDVFRKEKIADKYLNKHIREVMSELKVDKHIGFHSARHSFAYLSSDIDVRQLQKIFRHSNITTTIGYMESIKHTDADDALEKVIGF
ncbi:tyrosine-type recombinase/integrase [Polaribacter sp.]|nr:tyrosine-type recombinase/integrase [Polaribacter sp.]